MKLWEVDKMLRLLKRDCLPLQLVHKQRKENELVKYFATSFHADWFRKIEEGLCGTEARKDKKYRRCMAQLVFLSMLHPYKLSAKQLLKLK